MLSGKQKRFLRGLGHSLKPVLLVGKAEVNEALLKEAAEALAFHELIKVKVLESCLLDRHAVAEKLAASCEAEIAQVLGRTILLYKESEEKKIELPRESRRR